MTNDDQNWIAKYRAAIGDITPAKESWLEALVAEVKAVIQELVSSVRWAFQKEWLQRRVSVRTRNLDLMVRGRKLRPSSVKSGQHKQNRAS